MSSTISDEVVTPEGGPPRPVALAGCLWLAIAGLFGIAGVYVMAIAPMAGLLYLVPVGLLAAFGVRLITGRNGIGLPLLSMLLGTSVAVIGLLETIRQTPTTTTDNVVIAVVGSAIALCSAWTVWTARAELPALRAGMGRRALLVILVAGLYVGIAALAVNVGPLRGCVPIAPRELPSGAAPGEGIEGVSAGAKQVIWGAGADRVEQIVGLTFWQPFGPDDGLTLVRSTTIHGQPATIYRMDDSSGWDLGFSWAEDGCDRSVFLAPGTTPAAAEDFAARF